MKRKISNDPDLNEIDDIDLIKEHKRIKYSPRKNANEPFNSAVCIDYLNRTSELDKQLTHIDFGLLDISDENDSITSSGSKNDSLIVRLIEIDLNDQEKLRLILKGLSDLDSHLAVLLENIYDTINIKEKGFKTLNTIDFERFNLLNEVNLKLNNQNQFSFYLVNAKLKVSRRSENRNKEESVFLYLNEWYDLNGDLCGLVNVPSTICQNIIDFSRHSINFDLKVEKAWLNCLKHIDEDQNTIYSRYLLVLWPKQTEFSTFLSIDYKFSIDYLHARPSLSIKCLEALIDKCLRMRYMNKTILSNEYICKLADILEVAHDASLTKQFVSYIIESYSDEIIIQRIVYLITIYGWEVLGESIIELMVPVTLDNVCSNCRFVQHLKALNQEEISLVCLKSIILPIFSRAHKFSKSIDVNPQSTLKILYTIAETFVSFKNSEDYMISYKNLINQITNPLLLKQLIEEFIKNFDHFKKSKSIQDMFKLRLKWLANMLKNVPNFSFIMEAKITGHKAVEEFLRSENESMIYTGKFKSIKAACDFATRYGGLKRGHSTKMIPSGVDKTAQVLIIKTQELFQNQQIHYKMFETEYKLIESKLKLFVFFD